MSAFDEAWVLLKQNGYSPNNSSSNPYGVETDFLGMPTNVPEGHKVEQVPHPCPVCGGSGVQQVPRVYNPADRM